MKNVDSFRTKSDAEGLTSYIISLYYTLQMNPVNRLQYSCRLHRTKVNMNLARKSSVSDQHAFGLEIDK